MVDTTVYLSGERIQGASTDALGAVDSLGTAVNGSNSGCVTSSDTPFYGDTSVTFDDNDAAHDFGSNTSFKDLMKEDFTVTFWAKCSGKGNMGWGQGSNPTSSPYAGNQGCVLCLGQISGGGNGFVISFDDNNTNQFFVCAADGSNVILNDTQNDGADHDNNYHLYMLHFDNTNEELRVYRDGSSTARDTTAYEQEVTSTSATTYNKMYMGRQNNDDIRYYIGQLADVSIWKRLLTTAEFTQLWGTFDDNTTTATNSVKGVRVDALTNQVGLLAHWKLDDLNFTNSAVKTDKSKTAITNVTVGTRYEETDTLKTFRRKAGGLGGCIAYYPLNNSFDNYATTGNGFPDGLGSDGDLTAQSSASCQTSPKKLGSHAMSMPADADYAKTTEAEGANFDFTGDFSVTCWFYRDDGIDGGYHAMVSKREGGNSEMNFIVGTDSTLSCYINKSGVGGTNFASTQTFANATWYHAAVTRSGNTLKYYIDGSHTTTGTIGTGHSVTNTAPFALGAVSASGGEGFDGNLDDVSVWNRALSDDEISSIYNSGTGNAIPDATYPDSWVEKGTA